MKNQVLRSLMWGALALGGSVTAFGDVGVAVVASNPTPVAGGAAFAYTITVTNNGASLPLTVNDPLPQSVIFHNVSVVANPAAASLNCVGPPVGTSGTVECSSPFFATGTATITIVAQIIANAASGVRTNTVTASYDGAVPNVLPNSASVQQNIVNDAALQFTKSASQQVSAGGPISYNLAVRNTGNSSAINVTVTDQLPDGASFVSVFATGAFHDACAFRPAIHSVVCAGNFVTPGVDEITIVVESDSKAKGSIQNTATVTAVVPNFTASSSASTIVVKPKDD